MIIQAKDTAKNFFKNFREQDFILYDPFHKKQKFSSTNTEQPAFLRVDKEKKFILKQIKSSRA